MCFRWPSLLLLLMLAALGSMAAQPFIWREAETADKANFKIQANAAPVLPQVVSGGKWMQFGGESEEDFGAPHEWSYTLKVRVAGKYHLWFSLGYEFVRSPLHWRMDGGEWKTIKPTDLTTNLTGLCEWNEIGWISPAELDLTEGDHTLDFRVAERGGKGLDDDKYSCTIDVVALVMGDWTPDGPARPGQEPSGEIDLKAAAQVYQAPATIKPGERAVISLNGVWQLTRHDDPDMDKDTYQPVKDFPAQPHWHGINVPGDYTNTPGFDLGHRVIYRTKVQVPATLAGRSFLLDLKGTSWIASVFVNGKFITSLRSSSVPWQCDITSAIVPGKENEIAIGIKDVFYGYSVRDKKSTLDEMRNIPKTFWETARMRFVGCMDYSPASGITDPISLVVAGGPAFVDNVFVKTSVTGAKADVPDNKRIAADVTLTNPTTKPVTVTVQGEAIFLGTNQVEKKLPPVTVTVAPGATTIATLTDAWPDVKLWWPEDNPTNQYRLHATVLVNGQPIDSYDQTFGFREVRVDGIYIRLNGIRRNFWNLTGALSQGKTVEEKLHFFYLANNRFERFGFGMKESVDATTDEAQFNWTDLHGIPGRYSTKINGMGITQDLADPVTWESYREHIDQVTKAYRNHPSILTYSLENELVWIAGRLAFGGIMDRIEQEMMILQDIAHKNDPTRPCMADGAAGADGKFNAKPASLDICNTHYVEDGIHPDLSYNLDKLVAGGRWTWDKKRPYCAGEIAYFTGNAAEHAGSGGDEAALGQFEAQHAHAKYLRNLFERYRWNDVAMTHPWTGTENTEEAWIAESALAAFLKEQGASLFGGEQMTRTVKVFNDNFSKEPVQFTWTLAVDGKQAATNTQTLTIEPGFHQQLTITAEAPAVTVRTPATLTLEVTQPGNPKSKAFKDVRAMTVFPRTTQLTLQHPVFLYGGDAALTEQLTAMGLTVKAVKDLKAIPDPKGILLIAPYALAARGTEAASIFAYTRGGGRVICLEQDYPLTGDKEINNPLQVAKDTGWGTGQDPNITRVTGPNKPVPNSAVAANVTFAVRPNTGILAGLTDAELTAWAGGEPTAWRVWDKRWGEARAWIDCGPHLTYTALVEIPRGDGILYASQMRIGNKLGSEPAAQVLFTNMLRACDGYQAPTTEVMVLAKGQDEYNMTVQNLGARTRIVYTLEEGLETQGKSILLVRASLTNLNNLYRLRADVETFTKGGGWLLLWGLEPDGLNAYNQLLGTKHVMREYRAEQARVVPDPMSAGLRNTDITQYTDLELARWKGQTWPSWSVFTYCVDTDDIAPFCYGAPNPNYRPTLTGGFDAMVNGLTGRDSWRLINQFGSNGGDACTFRLPATTEIARVKVWNNTNYNSIENLSIKLDGKVAGTITLPDASAKANELVLPDAPAAKTVTLTVDSIRWHNKGTNLVGIDLVKIYRKPPTWYKDRVFPLVDNGALVRYPRGEGGFLLNQLKLKDDDLRDNQVKKQRILTTLLQNLGATFTGAQAAGGGDDPEGPEG